MKHECSKEESLLRLEMKVDKMSSKIDSLLHFRSRLMGGAAVIGTILSFVAAWVVNRL